MVSHKQHFATLDGLRGVAALMIVLVHLIGSATDYLAQHAYLAVDFFFLLSGFVIAYAYEAKLDRGMFFFAFVRVRMIRLYPMALLGSTLGFVVFCLQAATKGGINGRELIGAGVSGILLLPYPLDLPRFPQSFPTNVPEWSLFFELVVNFAFALLLPCLNTRRLVFAAALAAFCLALTAAHFNGLDIGVTRETFWAGIPRATFPFLLGALMFRFRPQRAFGNRVAILTATMLLVCLASPLRQAVAYDLICVFLLFPALLYLSASSEAEGATAGVFLWAGRISYPVYILHYPLANAAKPVANMLHITGPLLVLFFAICWASIIALGYLALKYFDEPLRNALSRMSR